MINDGKRHYELSKFKGELLDAQNIHLIKPKSEVKGVVSFSVCVSNMGIPVVIIK